MGGGAIQLGKVVVLGSAEAGKSTLASALSSRAINLEVRGRTVAMDHATLHRDGTIVSLVGVPGQAHFSAVREALVLGARGAVWVHRIGTETDGQTAALVGYLAQCGVPYIVVENSCPDNRNGSRWVQPKDAPRPRRVLCCDLAAGDGVVETIEEEIWKLCREPLRDQTEED